MFYKMIFSFIVFFTAFNASADIKNLKSFTADFTQSIKSINDKTIEYKGEVFIKNSGKILWKYKTPIEKNVYILNDFAIVDEPELEQAIYTQLQSEINIIKLLNTSKKINENSYIANIDDIDYLIESSNDTKQIEIIKYKDKLDNSVEIKFENQVSNEEINDGIFKFTAPEHYDIIRK
ncbi:LolA-like outer membrane lipoprotein chaperone [Poseidonibacter ostreae]|jgi:outer membrane lipoprotein carrier protein|uniref:Cell envelope biogenesis protein LolA n=1 Tax=Poseidonibacter ostreae TaxID=2654171 RepID=A0A6L4WPP3_9BACT|nr:LolA-like outer membrane lipoprotein chaperone [Poseidonibacter ostreae]KAB7885806.1 cell envelope biogenesis protein LolA [Poseidonibacter ostreae]KAB7886957.1 cell envelope biogenesis protein LolA [Poseidonibacter ostreae]KAB7892250.1 cell envelope biogenesis protein LolA [Poseidonibacter ostreae]